MNLATAFRSSAAKHARKAALFWGDEEYTYGRFEAQTNWLSDRLVRDFRIQPGDRVALWLKNCPQFVPALLAVLQAGAVVVPINSFLKLEEALFILEDSAARLLVTDTEALKLRGQIQERRPALGFFAIEDLPEHPHPPTGHGHGPARQESDLAIIIYTSGTTGRPKGAMLSHGNLLCNVESCRQVLETVDLDRFAIVLPMFHSFMLCVGILLPLLTGCSVVVVKSLHPLKNLLDEIRSRGATILPGIPQFFRALIHSPIPADFPVRLCLSGAAPLPVEVLREFNRKYPFPLIEGYGLSEASPVVSLNPIRGPWKEGSIGVPIPGVEVAIQDDHGHGLPDSQVGELCVRGGNVMLGYWNQPAETAKALRHGWLLTGDVGYRDRDGYFFITDRKKDMLLVNGINVYPREIEEVLYEFPGVKEAAVIGQPDPRRGEQPLAFVVLDDGATLDERAILQFLRGKLADYKVPRRIESVASLPHNTTGKILKTALREVYSRKTWSPP